MLMLAGCGSKHAGDANLAAHGSAEAPSHAERAVGVASVKPTPGDGVTGVVLPDTEALTVHDPVGRNYPIWVALPADYAAHPQQRYPVLYVTDALYSFPLVRSLRNLVSQHGVNLEDFILVGLPPQQGLTSKQSRSRDYTPSAPVRHAPDDFSAEEYGGAAHYRDFLATTVLPMIDARYRTDPARRAFAGHSYGGLFGAYVLVTRPELFHTYILSSPSLWYDDHVIDRFERDYANDHRALRAQVLLSVGSYETFGPGPRYFHQNNMLLHNRDFAQRLRSRHYEGLKVETSIIDGEDHFTVYPTVLTRALIEIFPGTGPYVSG
ncbi:alpha/beta hydrolase [Rhodanobacter sp. Col0626]|uniref:alpha/beta hydrolase n=1 Tax=Rhodanobacter sp. Col0626 TaxID=3415679 RepID=UPI003CECC669